MMSRLKKAFLLLLTCLLTTGICRAQKDKLTEGKAQVSWLIALIHARTVSVAVDSVKVKGYNILVMQGGKGNNMGLRMIYSMPGDDQCGLASNDGEILTAVFINSTSPQLYKQQMILMPAMGFKPDPKYKAGPGETAYSKDRDVLIFKNSTTGDKPSYAVIATRLLL